jgi:hypothetical protein
MTKSLVVVSIGLIALLIEIGEVTQLVWAHSSHFLTEHPNDLFDPNEIYSPWVPMIKAKGFQLPSCSAFRRASSSR